MKFWYAPRPTLTARLLQPLALLYGLAAEVSGLRKARNPYYPAIPVISIGNLTVGGAGKTPVTQWLAAHYAAQGHQVAIVSRGYGGSETTTPTRVTLSHTAAQVGDEPRMLANHFAGQPVQVWVCKNRPQAVRRAEQAGATLILLDDGFQRQDVARTANILVIDGRHGRTSAFGNGLTLPAGPLREFPAALKRATFAVVLNEPQSPSPAYYGVPAYRLNTRLSPPAVAALPSKSPIAFAGLAKPEKFFESLTAAGISPIQTLPFPDHHAYTPTDLQHLKSLSQQHGQPLVTTQKDAVKLPHGFAHALPLEVYGPDVPSILAELENRLR